MTDPKWFQLAWIAQCFATVAMTGVIWAVHFVIYPLFAKIDASSFATYHARYMEKITLVVGPLMLLEVAAAGTCLFLSRSSPEHLLFAVASLLLIGIIWANTAFGAVPIHQQLQQGYDIDAIHALVRSNLIRTLTWTLRCGLLAWWGYRIWLGKST